MPERTAYYRQQKRRKRAELRERGLEAITLWAYPECKDRIREYAEKANRKVAKARRGH